MLLIDKDTAEVLKKGDRVTTFRGEDATLTGWDDPHRVGSVGRVYLRVDGRPCDDSFFPGVINAQFVEGVL